MRDCLLIMHAREIPVCVHSFQKLKIPKIWFRGYNMKELETVIPKAINETDFDNYIICSDDTTPEQRAVDYVSNLLQSYEVASGWSNMKPNSQTANVSLRPLRGSRPGPLSVTWPTIQHILDGETIFRVYFAGFSMTGARRYIWQKFPYRVFEWALGRNQEGVNLALPRWWASDYNFCLRLQQAQIPIYCHKLAFVYHLGSIENLLVGNVTPEVIKDFEIPQGQS